MCVRGVWLDRGRVELAGLPGISTFGSSGSGRCRAGWSGPGRDQGWAGGGAGEVERGHREGGPGRVRRVSPRGQVRQRPVLELGDDLLDDRVVAVAFVGLEGVQGALVMNAWCRYVANSSPWIVPSLACGWSRLTRRTTSRHVTC